VTADGLTRLLGDLDDTAAGVLVISPHLDDAVLSCGALLAHLAPRHLITVATVFTAAAPPPWSLPGRRQLRELGGVDAEDFFAQCRAEDADVLAGLGAAEAHLGFRDALFRRGRRGRPTRPIASMPPAAGSRPATSGWPPR
jgi:LmbE family N-acetylglucosaminyl deacetylase